jgi:hypothetical protein
MNKTVVIIGDEGGQVTQALLRVTGRPTCTRLASGGVSCQSGVCEESNASCMGTKVTDYSSGGIDRSTWGSLKVSPHLPSNEE